MPTLALLPENIIAAAKPVSRQARQAEQDPSAEGILVFCGISAGLTVLALVFSVLNLPSAYLL